jgi:molybdenum cofactor cytidylyltransferase
MTNKITGILLAAGQSKRFGGNKLLQTLPDSNKTIACQSASTLLRVLPNSIAIVNDDEKLKQELTQTGITVIENSNAISGMGTSIACAIQHSTDANGWVISLADMPYIPEQIVQSVVDGLESGHNIVAPTFNQQQGHPVGFARMFINELLNLKGDRGAKNIINDNLSCLHTFETHSNEILKDVDHPDDFNQNKI